VAGGARVTQAGEVRSAQVESLRALAVAVAAISYWSVLRPFLRLRRRWGPVATAPAAEVPAAAAETGAFAGQEA
jgi:peptidoglycan/LPS O-acetylase OafA/YrhL